MARISIIENQQWLPVVNLLGLMSCSVPPFLKSEILHTLTALVKTPEIATAFWQSLEVSQVIHKENITMCNHGITMVSYFIIIAIYSYLVITAIYN